MSVSRSRTNVRRSFSCDDGARRRQGGEEQQQRELDERDDLEQQQAEPGGLAEGGVLGEPDGRLPGGDADDPEEAEGGDAGGVVPVPPGDGQELAVEDRPEHAGSLTHETGGTVNLPTDAGAGRARRGAFYNQPP